MNDYERVARLIRYLDARHVEQPSLADLADHLGLSSSHLHRLFSEWAGVTPKDFLQCLTLSHAKQLLRAGRSVLDAAHEAGFSGPSRLHDLCVSLEAASPGEIKSGGAGLRVIFGFAQTPFGECLLGETDRGICHLAFPAANDRPGALAELRSLWTNADLIHDDRVAETRVSEIFRHPSERLARRPLRALVRGSSFQVRVWNALVRVPPGLLVTYGDLAAAIGQPNASRAVGSAVGSNNISWLIPCHRVIRGTGILGGYRWDPVRKQAMIAWETPHKPAAGCAGDESRSRPKGSA